MTGAPSTSGRRGGAYVLVLMVSLIVMTIGLSALLGHRVRQRAAASSHDSADARVLAISAVDLGLLTIDTEPSWRSLSSNDTWSAPIPLNGGEMAFKFVDADGDLADLPYGVVEVIGRGTYGDAVQLCGVTLGGSTSGNLLANPGGEDGLAGWIAHGDCNVEVNAGTFYAGAQAIAAGRRRELTAGPARDITSLAQVGAVFETEAWIYIISRDDDVRIVIDTTNDVGDTTSVALRSFAPADTWVKVSGTLAPSWSGTLTSAVWRVDTVSEYEYLTVDDAVLRRVVAGEGPAAGTWRREAESP